jgi:DNA-binding protein HU-beta
MKNVSKEMMIDKLATKTGASKKEVGEFITAFMDAVMKEVSSGNKVTFTGFGVFKPVQRKARTGVNPATKAKIQIPARSAVKFKAGKKFSDMVK